MVGKFMVGAGLFILALSLLAKIVVGEPSDGELKARAAEFGVRYESDWGNSFSVTATEFGPKWPFTASSAEVFCKMTEYDRPMVTVSFDGSTTMYGLNGVALGKEKMMRPDDHQKRNVYGYFVGDTASLIQRAIAQCGSR